MREADDVCCDRGIKGYTKNTYLISGEKSQLQAKPATCNKHKDNYTLMPPRAQRGTLIISYIHRLGSFLGVQNFELHLFIIFFFFFLGGGGVRKMNIFGGMKILWIFLGGCHKIRLCLGVTSMHFRFFFS